MDQNGILRADPNAERQPDTFFFQVLLFDPFRLLKAQAHPSTWERLYQLLRGWGSDSGWLPSPGASLPLPLPSPEKIKTSWWSSRLRFLRLTQKLVEVLLSEKTPPRNVDMVEKFRVLRNDCVLQLAEEMSNLEIKDSEVVAKRVSSAVVGLSVLGDMIMEKEPQAVRHASPKSFVAASVLFATIWQMEGGEAIDAKADFPDMEVMADAFFAREKLVRYFRNNFASAELHEILSPWTYKVFGPAPPTAGATWRLVSGDRGRTANLLRITVNLRSFEVLEDQTTIRVANLLPLKLQTLYKAALGLNRNPKEAVALSSLVWNQVVGGARTVETEKFDQDKKNMKSLAGKEGHRLSVFVSTSPHSPSSQPTAKERPDVFFSVVDNRQTEEAPPTNIFFLHTRGRIYRLYCGDYSDILDFSSGEKVFEEFFEPLGIPFEGKVTAKNAGLPSEAKKKILYGVFREHFFGEPVYGCGGEKLLERYPWYDPWDTPGKKESVPR